MNGKLLAIGMVAVMIIAGLAVMLPGGSDAASGDGGSYTYVLEYDESEMSVNWATSTALSMDGMDAIYHPSYNSTTGATTGYGSWTWNATTGMGPFNSFYAAFDLTDGNKFVAIMDPFELTHGIDGTDYTASLADLNIMWVLPTVYWKTDSTHLYLTNDPGEDTDYVAYAHTINGHVYNYIAIGVYEGSTLTIDETTILTSTSGATPTASLTRADFRTAAQAYGTDGELDSSLATDAENPAYSMLWNFYQWELFKYCSYTLMENFNSQNTVGNGFVYGTNHLITTGTTNNLGPYTGNPGIITNTATDTTYGSDAVRLFIENAWGGLNDFVDGIVVDANQGFYIDTKSTPDDATSTSDYVSYKAISIPTSGYGTAIFTDAEIWGISSSTENGSATTGTTDRFATATTGTKVFFVGGSTNSNPTNSVYYGMSFADAGNALNSSNVIFGARLAFVFDATPEFTVTYNVSGVTTSQTFDYGDVPSPADPTAPEGYLFYGWEPAITAAVADVTYTAVFVEIGALTVPLNAEGGSVSTNTIAATQGQPIGTLPTPTKTGFDFDGWFTAAEGGTEVTAETIVTEDMTIYAHWEITGTWNTYKVLVYAMITLLFVGIAVAILRNYVGGDRY